MRNPLRIACGVALAALALAGCRLDAAYTINPDDTVSGRVYVAVWLDPGNPGSHEFLEATLDSNAQTIADAFTTSVMSAYVDGNWYGHFIDITDEPLASFSGAPEAAWDIQIIKTGNKYRVNGYTTNDDDEQPRPSARSNGGYITVDVRMPGELQFAISATTATESPARVSWDLLNVVPIGTTPYAISDNSPPPPPDPDPVVTIVIPPDLDPVVTPVVTPSATPSVSPSAVPASNGDGDSIPVWVWAVGGGLVAALAGTIGFAVANRKPPVPVAPAAKPKAKAEEEPAEEEPTEEEPEEEKPAEKKKSSPKKKK